MAGPDDRPRSESAPQADVDPRIYVVVGKDKFPRPALETFFVRTTDGPATQSDRGCACDAVVRTYCSCNKVCTCVPVRVGGSTSGAVTGTSATKTGTTTGAQTRSTPAPRRCSDCSCAGHTSGGGSTVVGCSCAPVH
jgi:hypothetical protein